MIPAWFPQRLLFTYLTGAGHVAAGLSLLTGVLLRLSTALLCFMFACFVLLLHVPRVLNDPTSRHEWTMLFVASLFNGAAWLVAAVARSPAIARRAQARVRKGAPATVRSAAADRLPALACSRVDSRRAGKQCSQSCQHRCDDGDREHRARDSHQEQRRECFARDDVLIEQYVREDDHDERLRLQEPADERGFAGFPLQDAAGEMRAEQFARNRCDQQQASGDEDGFAAHRPVRAQSRAQEEYRHHDEQYVMAELIHLPLIEPVAVHDRAGQERADHEVQAAPVGTETAEGEPDQPGVPAILLGDSSHQDAEEIRRKRKR